MRIILGCEIGMAIWLTAQFFVEIWIEGGWIIFWSLPAVILAIVLGLAFKQLVKLQR